MTRLGARAAISMAAAILAGCATIAAEPSTERPASTAAAASPDGAPPPPDAPRDEVKSVSTLDPAAILALPVHAGNEAARPLRDVLGATPAVVTIWASYCVPCRAEVPILEDAAERWKGVDVRVVSIVGDVHDPKRLAKLRKDWDVVTPTYWVAEDAEVTLDALLPHGLPSTFFVKGDTVVRHDHLLTDTSLPQLAQQLLGVCVK